MSLSKVVTRRPSSGYHALLSAATTRHYPNTRATQVARSETRWSSTNEPRKKTRGRTFLKRSLGLVLAGTVGYYTWRYLEKVTRPSFPNEPKKKIVILGSGWSAMSLLNHLNPDQFDITVISPRNYFLFTPILPSVTVGTVESRSIVEPIRRLIKKFHRNDNVHYYEAECLEVLHKDHKVYCQDMSGIQGSVAGFHLDYDILVVGVGADVNTFNTPGVRENCLFLKEMEDAHKIRDTIIDLIESASYPGQPEEERKRLLNFVVVGGGPTGVEFASEVRDFLRDDIPKIYPNIIEDFKVMLVQSGDHLLNTYDAQISSFTEQNFKKEDNNVSVITGTRVTEVRSRELVLMDKATRESRTVPYGMCVWSTGVSPKNLTKKLMIDVQKQSKGRALLTDSYLRVKGADGIFALGDCSTIEQDKMIDIAESLFKAADINGDGTLSLDEFRVLMDTAMAKYPQVSLFFSRAKKNVDKLFAEVDTSGDQLIDLQEFKLMLKTLDGQLKNLPATAQVASQQGKYLGKLLSKTNGNILVQDLSQLEQKGYQPFEYKHLGSFAYVGDNKAVLEVPVLGALNGWWVMWLWRAAYASECASLRTKVLLVTDWIKSFIFGRDTSRI